MFDGWCIGIATFLWFVRENGKVLQILSSTVNEIQVKHQMVMAMYGLDFVYFLICDTFGVVQFRKTHVSYIIKSIITHSIIIFSILNISYFFLDCQHIDSLDYLICITDYYRQHRQINYSIRPDMLQPMIGLDPFHTSTFVVVVQV